MERTNINKYQRIRLKSVLTGRILWCEAFGFLLPLVIPYKQEWLRKRT